MATTEWIVVGWDYTPCGMAALRWGITRAAEAGASVLVVHAFDVSTREDLAMERDLDGARRDSRCRAHEWIVDLVAGMDTTVPVRVSTAEGPVADVLVAAARDARMVVIGTPQSERHRDLRAKLEQGCKCPVVSIDADDVAVAS